MSVTKTSFGCLPDGREVEKYTLTGKGGLEASFLTFGATLQALRYRGEDRVLGYDDIDGYLPLSSYQGATVGRCANRISGLPFTEGGVEVRLPCNENPEVQLHGGVGGFSGKLWTAEILEDGDEPAVRFSIESPDGEEGYPGNLTMHVTMRIAADNTWHILYEAKADKDTLVSPTNHAYFKLDGEDTALDTLITLESDAYLPVDDKLLPTGECRPVAGTPFDFRTAKPIGRDLEADDEQLRLGKGYDHNFNLRGKGWRLAATAVSPHSGVRLECYTDRPGIQFYTANCLDESVGRGGVALHKNQGFCLETQCWPDAPHRPEFPSIALKAGEVFRSETAYRFSMEP